MKVYTSLMKTHCVFRGYSHRSVEYQTIGAYCKFNFTIAIVLMAISSWGQKIDSLKSLLQSKDGLNSFNVLYSLAYEYIDVDDELALYYSSEAYKIAKNYGDSLGIVKAGRIKSLAQGRLGVLDSSLILSLEILPIASRNNYTEELNHILNRLGSAYVLKADYDNALEYYLQSLSIREKNGDKFDLSVILHNIGYVFFKLEDYDKALLYYTRSLNLKSEIENKYDLDNLLINLGLCYTYKKDYSKAREFIDQALSLCKNHCSKNFVMQVDFSLGLIYFGLGELERAERHFYKSYNSAREVNNERFQLDNIVYLSKVNIHQNELVLAEKYLIDAEKLADSGTPYNLELIKIYHELFSLYERLKKFDRMAMYQNKYIQLKDSIYGEELTRNLMKIEADYLERENKALIVSQAEILSLKDEVIFRQRFMNAFIGIIALLLIVLSYVLIRSNRRERATNHFLEQKVRERTVELEKSNDALVRSLEEQTIVFQKLSSEMKSFIATIKGLCSLSLTDSETAEGGQYIRKIETTSDQLLGIVNKTLSPKTTK